MTLDKTEKMNAYLDFYGMLLTEKQLSALEYYYRENYSYSEIADLENTSRAAVYDLIKRSEALLEDYESKMHLYISSMHFINSSFLFSFIKRRI